MEDYKIKMLSKIRKKNYFIIYYIINSLMVENCIGKVSLPLGLGLNFLINGKHLQIPMSVDEPSVIAAASSAAKFIAENGK